MIMLNPIAICNGVRTKTDPLFWGLRPRKFNLPLAYGLDKCNNGRIRFLVAQGVTVAGFMSGGMVIGTVPEVFAITSLV